MGRATDYLDVEKAKEAQDISTALSDEDRHNIVADRMDNIALLGQLVMFRRFERASARIQESIDASELPPPRSVILRILKGETER